MVDTKETVNCPACGCEMKKVFIENAGVNVDICTDGCGGILFDNRELEKFDEPHENAEKIFEQLKDKIFKQADESKQKVCPICHTNMVKMGAGHGNVKMDVCNVCGAKFLDYGELEKIRTASQKQYKENELTKQTMAMLANEALNEATGGEIGAFVNKYFPSTGGRKAVEYIVSKFNNLF